MLLVGAVAVAIASAVVLCVWLNAPRSLLLMVQGIGYQRQPANFDFEFAGIAGDVPGVRVDLAYYPRTPIFGISKHWTNVISPPAIDQIYRTLQVPAKAGRVHFAAPLGLVGLSNYRLIDIRIGEDAPYAVEASVAGDVRDEQARPPRNLDIPFIAVNAGAVRYDGALALWRANALAEVQIHTRMRRAVPPPHFRSCGTDFALSRRASTLRRIRSRRSSFPTAGKAMAGRMMAATAAGASYDRKRG